jgi:hypothetical protein
MRTWHRVLSATAALTLLTACGENRIIPPTEPPPVEPPPPAAVTVVLGAAGNIAKCTNDRDEATAALLDGLDWVVALGDNAFETGSLAEYTDCYGPSWGRFLDRTLPVLGNRDYQTPGATGFFDYFGDRAGPRGKGFYSMELGEWHVIVLNDTDSLPATPGSEQDQWLAADLAADSSACTLVISHVPRFTSSNVEGSLERPSRTFLWQRLYDANVEVLLHGQHHHYERMVPLNPAGERDDARGIRQFNVGTGGEAVEAPTAIHPSSETRAAAFGVLKLTLKPDGYDWTFVGIPGETFSDSGSGSCR